MNRQLIALFCFTAIFSVVLADQLLCYVGFNDGRGHPVQCKQLARSFHNLILLVDEPCDPGITYCITMYTPADKTSVIDPFYP